MPSPTDTQPMVVAFAGRRIDADGAKTARFPFANVCAVRTAIGASLEQIAPSLLIASAACGADLIALEAAASRGIRMRIVLPFLPQRFRATSVVDRPNPEFWGRLYDDIIKGAEQRGDVIVLHCSENDADAYSAANMAVGMWGAVHKRLWEVGADRADLDHAIGAYERGFFIRNDYYNGINYAFMLDVRATLTSGDEALADCVLARRIRRRVFEICEDHLKVGAFPPDEKFWIGASKVEALFGLDRKEEAERVKTDVVAEERERLRADGASDQEGDWKEKSLNEQLRKLEKLLAARA